MQEANLEIDLLRAFLAVAETGSFTAAADVVGRSQSAVSQKVLRLEEIVQRRVFSRTSRSLRLTPDGERLLLVARRMLEMNDAFLRELRDAPIAGTLRLGISENLVPTQLPKLLARFCKLYPGIHLELMTGLSTELITTYWDGGLDAVIARNATEGPVQPGRVIWKEPLVWMAATDYEPDFTQPTRLVMLRPPCNYRNTMTEALDAIGQDWVTACTASSLAGVQAAVAGGMGVTVLGKSFVQDGMEILHDVEHWPALPMTEVMVIGEESGAAQLVKPLVEFLTERLIGTTSLNLAA